MKAGLILMSKELLAWTQQKYAGRKLTRVESRTLTFATPGECNKPSDHVKDGGLEIVLFPDRLTLHESWRLL
jgi:hypothetical protein